MKKCPKCSIEHDKPGLYCSRSCSNSRVWSDEINKRRSAKLSGKKVGGGVKDIEKWKENIRLSRLKKYQNTPFDNLGTENRRRRVFEEQNYCCANCGINEWFSNPLSLELEHKDGNSLNNSRENLEGLCPNCHSITKTWRGRNKPSKNGLTRVTDEFLLECYKETSNIRQALLKAGIAAKGNNYERLKNLLILHGLNSE